MDSYIDTKKIFKLPSHSSPGRDLLARAARLQETILAWSESEGNFDFESSDS